MSDNKGKDISRRQFLNYALMGTGGFLAAGILSPMLRFAIDPALKTGGMGDMVAVGDVSEFGSEPKRVDFKVHTVDGWYETESPKSAWVQVTEDGEILALSPICKHLGCTVNWNTGPNQNEFYCPCHDGRYYKNGVNVPNTPPLAPLDAYEAKVVDGKLYLGKLLPNPNKEGA